MNRILLMLTTALLVAGASMVVASPTPSAATTKRLAAAEWARDGLQPVKVKGLDLVYARPGALHAAYSKVRLAPISVEFQRNWERNAAIATGTRIRLRDITRIRNDIAQVVREEVVRGLARGGYQVVDVAGADVLEIDLRVAEVYLNAPDLPTVNFTRNYTRSFGEMTLIAELRDPASGAAVMRILDRTVGRDYGMFRFTTRVENSAEVGMAAHAWARKLSRELDLARGIGQS